MAARLKPVGEQTIVITGASSGIGLTTARMAAKMGARVVLVARSEEDLRRLEQEIRTEGGEALAVPADVADPEAVHRVAEEATSRWGGFDTWVNDAGVSIYGPFVEASEQDSRRLFDTNFWGVVNGCREAIAHLRTRGGALVNVGSETSDRAIPLQALYSASKHAVKGLTDSIRMEIEHEKLPISVTLVKPSATDTPFPRHAKTNMEREPALPSPVYAPEEVAHAILYAASHRVRDLPVGSQSRTTQLMGALAPRLTDKYMQHRLFEKQKGGELRRDRDGALHEPGGGLQERAGQHHGYTRPSLYTRSLTHPWLTRAIVAAAAAVAVGRYVSTRDRRARA